MCEIVCTPFKSGVSISHSPLTFPNISPVGSSKPDVLGAHPSSEGPLGWDPDVGSDPLLLGENLCHCDYPPICGHTSRVMSLDFTLSLLFLPLPL